MMLLNAVMLAELALVPPLATGRTPVIPPAGMPVQFVRTPDAGVPSAGVTKVGDIASTALPEPVTAMPCITVALVHCAICPLTGVPVLETLPPPDGVAHVPSPRQNVDPLAAVPLSKFVTGKLPVTPVVNGRPVALVSVAADGVPMSGVVSAGDVVMATLPVPLIAYSPNTPALSKSTRVVVPLETALDPTTSEAVGAPHVPSPRQNVEPDAPVPEFKFATGRLPVTPVASEISGRSALTIARKAAAASGNAAGPA